MKDNVFLFIVALIPLLTLSGILKLITIVSFVISGWSVYRREKIIVEDRFDGSWKVYFKDALKTRTTRKKKNNVNN
jgi:hypothetical protein